MGVSQLHIVEVVSPSSDLLVRERRYKGVGGAPHIDLSGTYIRRGKWGKSGERADRRGKRSG